MVRALLLQERLPPEVLNDLAMDGDVALKRRNLALMDGDDSCLGKSAYIKTIQSLLPWQERLLQNIPTALALVRASTTKVRASSYQGKRVCSQSWRIGWPLGAFTLTMVVEYIYIDAITLTMARESCRVHATFDAMV
jgi:hypothetical protein